MAIDDLKKKTSELAGQAKDVAEQHADKIEDALQSDKAEEISDKILGGAADLANKLTGGKYADKVEEVRENLDGKIGNE